MQSIEDARATGVADLPMNPAAQQTTSLLRELDDAEDKVARMLELAAEVTDQLAAFDSVDASAVQATSRAFLQLAGEVHSCLATKAHMIRDYRHYERSGYGARQGEALLRGKAALLREELRRLQGGGSPNAGAAALAAAAAPPRHRSSLDDMQESDVTPGHDRQPSARDAVSGQGLLPVRQSSLDQQLLMADETGGMPTVKKSSIDQQLHAAAGGSTSEPQPAGGGGGGGPSAAEERLQMNVLSADIAAQLGQVGAAAADAAAPPAAEPGAGDEPAVEDVNMDVQQA
ncbi:hypothetical protein JKP88DRAFT_354101 [Tribonema minus]|uniref:Mediator complex subunit 11 n=1 Tax=Tribonema minus TaxID=303371 RepID=A0A835Z3G6_9STRA|nr:hypothetical protein JKP88DRAFT_354101 [Tribonema minus]